MICLVVGSINIDTILNVKEMVKEGETKQILKIESSFGGKGANQAYTLAKLNNNVIFLSCVGNDENGKKAIENLKKVRVNTRYIKQVKDKKTGEAFIEVDEKGNNRILINAGANECVNEKYINEHIDLIKKSDVILLQLEIPIKTAFYVIELAKKYNKIIILDPAPAVNDIPNEVLNGVDIIKPNEAELNILTNKIKEKSITQKCEYLYNLGIKNIIVSLGNKGSILYNKEGIKKFGIMPSEVVDTTAAGDSFTAAITSEIIKGKSIEEAIKYATLVSSIVVSKKGAQSSIPTYEEVERKRDLI